MARADEVKSLVDVVTERVNNLKELFDKLIADHDQTTRALDAHLLKYTEEIGRLLRAAESLNNLIERQQKAEDNIATLKSACDELSSWKERQEREQEDRRRPWLAVVPNVVTGFIAALFASILTALTTYFIVKK